MNIELKETRGKRRGLVDVIATRSGQDLPTSPLRLESSVQITQDDLKELRGIQSCFRVYYPP